MAGRGQGPVSQLVPGRRWGVFDLFGFGERAEGMHANRRRRGRSGNVVFWARVDLRKGGQAPPLLWRVGE